MPESPTKLPLGNVTLPRAIRTAADIGQVMGTQRRALGLRQIDMAGIGNTGNRLVVDIEKGKPTVQLQKVLDMLDLLGLELTVNVKNRQSPS